MENSKYDLIFVGAGPSTIGAVLKLIKNNYSGKIAIIEKGKDLEHRQSSEVVYGFAGAGAYSDSKLTSGMVTGAIMPNLTQEELNSYSNYILEVFNEFKSLTSNKSTLSWDNIKEFDTSNTDLTFDRHLTCHVGTENGQAIYLEMERFIKSQPNIDLITEVEVLNIDHNKQGFKLYCSNGVKYTAKDVVVATGQKNTLPGKLMTKFNLITIPREFQIGVRVEDTMNPQYEEIIKANYDFKFVKEYDFHDNVHIRVRTFCCNSGNAHTCAERTSEGYTCFNGHAYKTPDPNNHTVNYGIMCECSGLDFDTKTKQIKLVKEVNALPTWKEDNFTGDKIVPKRKLLEGFDVLSNVYPSEVIEAMTDFMWELNKLVDLSKAYYLYPEIKLNEGKKPLLNKGWETTFEHLYMIGDCSYTRGIIKSIISGIQFAEEFLAKNEL